MKIFRGNLTPYPANDEGDYNDGYDGIEKLPNTSSTQTFHNIDDVMSIIKVIEKEFIQARDPVVLPLIPMSTNANAQLTSQPWIIDKRNRKHLFAMVSGTTTINLVSDDGFTVTIGNTWENVGFPEGTRFSASAANVNVLLAQIATDEVIP